MKCLLLLLPLLACTALDWQPVAIDQRVTVQLPAQPTEVDFAKLAPNMKPDYTRLWMLRAPEGIYQIMRSPQGMNIGPQDEASRDAFYRGMLSSLLRNDKGQLVAMTPFPAAGGTAIEYEYKGIHKGTGKRVLKFVRCLVLDSISYTLNFTPTDKLDSLGLAGAEQRKRFYNSLTIKP